MIKITQNTIKDANLLLGALLDADQRRQIKKGDGFKWFTGQQVYAMRMVLDWAEKNLPSSERERETSPWVTPRSWEEALKLLKKHKHGVPDGSMLFLDEFDSRTPEEAFADQFRWYHEGIMKGMFPDAKHEPTPTYYREDMEGKAKIMQDFANNHEAMWCAFKQGEQSAKEDFEAEIKRRDDIMLKIARGEIGVVENKDADMNGLTYYLVPLAPKPTAASNEWTTEDAAAASKEGWNIFDNNEHGLRIERDDDDAFFATDDAAITWVLAHAQRGNPLHVKAYAIHRATQENAPVLTPAELSKKVCDAVIKEFLPKDRDAALHVVKEKLYAIRKWSEDHTPEEFRGDFMDDSIDNLIDLIERS